MKNPVDIHGDSMPLPANEAKSCLNPDFTIVRVLGDGADSVVHEVILGGTLSATPQRAALKEYQSASEPFFDDEKQIHLKLTHPNIIELLHVVEKPQSPCYGLVLELAVHGTLHDYVNNQLKGATAHQSIIMGIFYGIYAALTYMHEKRVIHADLKEANVLISQGNQGVVSKLADFSLSLNLEDDMNEVVLDSSRGSIGYKAPELMKPAQDGKYHYTTAIDMWSASMICVNVMRKRHLNLGQPPQDLVTFINRSTSMTPTERPHAAEGQHFFSTLRKESCDERPCNKRVSL